MSDKAQTATNTITDQQLSQLHQRRSLDLIVGEWLSSTAVTTLVEPKMRLVSSCIIAAHGRTRKRSLQLQMYGSGSVLVPRFNFDDTTTVAELLGAAEEQAPVHKRPHTEKIDRLIFGGDKEVVVNRQETSACIASLGIVDNAVGFVIMINDAKILAERELSHARSAGNVTFNLFVWWCALLHYCSQAMDRESKFEIFGG